VGEDFLRKHTERFRCLIDADFEKQVNTNHLFSDRPHVRETVYRCRPLEAELVVRETDLLWLCHLGGSDLALIRGHVQIGTVSGADADDWRDAFRSDLRAGNMARVRLVEEPGLGGYFSVAFKEDERA
jgi:hypothetical protein